MAEETAAPWGTKKIRVSLERVKEGDWVFHDGAWRRVRDMRRSEHGQVLIFKDHPPKTVNAPLDVAREITRTHQGRKGRSTQ
ncbi:hypothetical protein ACFP1Z_23950 [Streptomyces gamaensis]|uniref:Uncharacterized protein n=1 Tax=Streptomyces gamaensis TaxID=1763542 RepID=A0ABW0Z851_9ACTN